jgi:photosystem II stability/assembly factor-like uncharacterized protein
MRLGTKAFCAWLLAWIGVQACAGASLDFAISVNLLSLYNRWGVDLQGNILIAANPTACTLPTVKPLYTCGPIWVGKLDPSGQNLLFATYLGSGTATSVFTAVAGIAADAQGDIVVAAHTTTANLPVVNAFQAAPKSSFTNLYIAKLAPDGSGLMYATYLGGSGGQTALSLAVDSAGSAYIAVSNNSTDFPTTLQSYQAPGLYQTAVAKLDANGALQYAALFPFEFYSDVKPIQVDSTGRAVLVSNLEAARLAPDGSSLIRAWYPTWATLTGPCATDATATNWCAEPPWALPRSNGGFQFAGAASLGVPVTENARQIAGETNGHLQIQSGQAIQTQLTATISGFAVDPQDHSRIYAATLSGLFMSEDNGATWSPLLGGPCLAIAVDPFDSTRLFASLDAIPNVDPAPRIYRSTDSGATWTAIFDGASLEERVVSLAADPHVQGLLYGAGPLLLRSTDGGDTWDSQSVGPSMENMSPSASTSTKSQFVLVDPTHAGWAYVVGITNCIGFCPNIPNLSRTQDGGNTWTDVSSSAAPPNNAPLMMAVDPNTGDVVEAVESSAIIYKNGDFTSPQVLYPAATTAIAFDPAQPGTIYLAIQVTEGPGSGCFVIESADDGVAWTNVLQFDRPVYNLTVSANGVLQASQTPDPPQAYFLISDPVGNITYGTYFGAALTQVETMAPSAAGFGTDAFIAGTTEGGLPAVDAVQPALAGGTDGFVFVFDDTGALLWSTYLGGSGNDSIEWVLPLPDGSVIVVGTTYSTDFPDLQPSVLGAGNTFIAHLRP